MKVTGYASDKDCRSRADNDKHQIKSELLFARQPDLAAVHTSLPFPLILSTETARRSFEPSIFFQKTTANAHDELQIIYTVKVKPDLQPLYGYLVGRGSFVQLDNYSPKYLPIFSPGRLRPQLTSARLAPDVRLLFHPSLIPQHASPVQKLIHLRYVLTEQRR
jgi:hypothetical protein